MRHRVLFFLPLLLIVSVAVAQQRNMVPVGQTKAGPEQRWALIIGIDRYKDPGVDPLKYAVADARAFYQTLTTIPDGFPAQHVMLMTDAAADENLRPTRNNILGQLTIWLGLAEANDTMLIYVAAHGMEEEGKSYILPQDARTAQLALTSIELEYVKEALRKCNARNKVLIVDACHSGAGRETGIMGTSMAEALSRLSAGMVVLASCDLRERSYEMEERGHGAYTYFLLEGLRGAADRDGDGVLGSHEVYMYAYDQTRLWAAKRGLKQTPKFVTAVSGDIVLGRAPRRPEPPGTPPQPPAGPIVTTPRPGETEFSLDDLAREEARRREKEAVRLRAEAAVKTEWEGKLREMETAFTRVQEFVKGTTSSDLKRGAWERFARTYAADDPYSSRDEELRQHAQKEMAYWETHYTNSLGMEFVLIPAGEFLMGSNDGESDEKPVHRVQISQPFSLGVHEVTQAQWEAVMGSNSSYFKGANRPVEQVSWEDAQEFIRRLNQREGSNTYRLPTEAEWEYACRAGTTGDYAGDLDAMGWYGKNAGGQTHPVGQKQPNAWGLYDMHGNVWEWCQDWYDSGYYARSPSRDPAGPSSGSWRGVRGGSWGRDAYVTRSSSRNDGTPEGRNGGIGCRCARSSAGR